MKSSLEKIFTLPNLLTIYRLMLAPILYLSILEKMYDVTVLAFLLSGLSDLFDGYLARRFHQISDLGKVIDPIADKLTYFFVLLGLCRIIPVLSLLFLGLIVKESVCGISSVICIRYADKIHGARWHGKLSSFVLYLTVLLHIVWRTPPQALSIGAVVLCLALLTLSCVFYVREHIGAVTSGRRVVTKHTLKKL